MVSLVFQMTHSNEREVLLTNMDVNATGEFYCEVSTEVPSIYTKASDELEITVYSEYPRGRSTC